MKEKTYGNNKLKTLQWGLHDAVVNGELHKDIPTRLVFVKNQTERDALQNVSSGQFVATYGLAYIWQKNGEGGWEVIRQGDD